jgi:hypothetical protein
MRVETSLILAMLLSAAPAGHERDLVTQLPAEVVECVVAARLDAAHAEGLLKELFQRLRMRPRYTLAVFPLPGDDRARLVFIRGKDADVALVKKALVAMDAASPAAAAEMERVPLMRVETGPAGPAEMRRRIVAAAARARLPVEGKDLFIHPEGAEGGLFFTGPAALQARVAELAEGLGKNPPPGPADAARDWLLGLGRETARSFGGLLSAALSAAAVLLLHLLLCRLPRLGARYRRSFRLFWEKLFASFKGKDLAWEIIKAAAEFGAAAALPAPERMRGAAPPRARALDAARRYARWRGIDPDEPEVRGLLDAAVDAEVHRAVRGEGRG